MINFKPTIYVGLDNRFVLVTKFPDEEEYAGLHEMLEQWRDFDYYIQDEPLEQGFYECTFELKQLFLFNPERDMTDAFLELIKLEKIK